jgi:hypothetical protein
MPDSGKHCLQVHSDNGVVVGNQNLTCLHGWVFLEWRLSTCCSASTVRVPRLVDTTQV